ncbi:hypothetical protein [Streptomyces sp. NPDC013455]|uniref:hypothetical protein n=1 Tax=Streptomyces sp. NPDC013455 TaxID=3155605 RepID=UPI0034045F25
MTAGHEDAPGAGGAGGAGGAWGAGGAGGAGEYAGMDALMTAITGARPPEEARRDPAFLAEHRAAEADLRVLREHLARLAETLTGEAGEAAEAAEAAEAPEAAEAAETAEAVEAGDARETGAAPVPGARRPRSRTRPAGPARPPRPGRPAGLRRAVRIALGALAGTAAFSLALGFGLLVTRAAGGADDNGGSSAKSAADAAGRETGTGWQSADPERALACSRLVVEGTVARVDRREGTARSRVRLTVTRSYKPAHGPAEVGFLLGADARPAPAVGQHVLVGVARDGRHASLWAVGDARVAAERAWITEALPGSRHTACPSGGAP